MSEDYWEGATWVYEADIVNDGSNSGNHEYDVVPGVGNEFRVIGGTVFNGDVASRVIKCEILSADGGQFLTDLMRDISQGAGDRRGFPQSIGAANDSVTPGWSSPIIVSGVMSLHAVAEAIAVSQDSAFALIARLRGRIPTVTLTSPADAVETVNVNRVF